MATSTPISRLSPAKINLFLHIVGRRHDGYHNLQTLFRLLNWGDTLHFLPAAVIDVTINERAQIHALCSQLIVLDGAENITHDLADNLIFKAARSLLDVAMTLQRLPKQLVSVAITLDKQLPMGAGLGGGSSNAATTLLTLNEIWQLRFTQDELIDIGSTIGADVPIFIFGQDAIAMGIGEELSAIDLPDQCYLILMPNAHINTAELFAHPKLRRNLTPLSIATIKNQTAAYVQNLNAPYCNVFSPVVTRLAPAVDKALKYLQTLESQALGHARMTGSGSTVFLPIDSSVAMDKELLAQWLKDAPCAARIVMNL